MLRSVSGPDLAKTRFQIGVGRRVITATAGTYKHRLSRTEHKEVDHDRAR